MKIRNTFPALLLLPLILVGCDWQRIRGNGNIRTEQIAVTDFAQADVAGFYEIEWNPGAPSLSITTDENLFAHITTRVEGKKLHIEMSGRPVIPTKTIKIVMTSPGLGGVQLSGATQFKGERLSGQTFALETSGAAKVTLSGEIHHLLADLTGASKLDAANLTAADLEISVTGAGEANVTATNSLQASITGAGKVIYGGNPKTVKREITGAGKINPRS